jgi:3-hydroxyisobutyrate dehydrogenase
MGCEKDSEFHARLAPQSVIPKSANFSNRIMLKSEDPGAPFEFDLEYGRSGSRHHPTFPGLAPRRIVGPAFHELRWPRDRGYAGEYRPEQAGLGTRARRCPIGPRRLWLCRHAAPGMDGINEDPPMSAKPEITAPAGVTVVGLGNMGVPMGACLVKAGYAVTGFDLSAAARKRFVDAGGRIADDAASAVAAAELVITLLPNGKVVREAVDSMRPHLRPGSIIVEMSSSAPLGTRQLGEELIAAGFEFIDAPVSGGVKRAADGTLAIMVGGDPTTIDRVDPVLAAMGRSIFRTGVLGSGHAMKALNNYVSAAGLVAVVEALQVGRKFGLDPALMADILNVSSGKNNTTELKLKQFIISQTFNAGFPLRLMAKDVRTADELGHALGLSMPLADLCTELWDDAATKLSDTADHTEIIRYMERLVP